MIKAVIFDMFETLISYHICPVYFGTQMAEEATRIRRSELFPYFDVVCFSNEQGICKPEKEIYHRCVEALSVQLEECLYVGDGGSRELETAQELGMKVVQATWYLKEGTSQPVGRMSEFEEARMPMDVVEFVK